MKISVHIEEWELTQPFRISNFEWINSRGIVVQLAEDGYIGRGEAQGVFYLNENAESIFAQVHEVAVERHLLDVAVGVVEDRHAGRLVDPTALHTDEPVFHKVHPAHAVLSSHRVQPGSPPAAPVRLQSKCSCKSPASA